MTIRTPAGRGVIRWWDGIAWRAGHLHAPGSEYTPPTPDPGMPPLPIVNEQPHPYAMPTAAPYEVPAPAITPSYEGSGEMVHPSVLDMTRHGFPQGFRGYRYWMGVTPYPDGQNIYENPSILVSNNGFDWSVPTGLTNPLDEKPGSTPEVYGFYNSDTELVWDPDGKRFILYWRRAYEVIHAATSTDGVTWTNHYRVIWHTSLAENRATMLSPSVVRRGPGQWEMFVIRNRGNHGEEDSGIIRKWVAVDPLGPWAEDVASRSEAIPLLWHAAVYFENGKYRMLANFRAPAWDLRAGVSTDGKNWDFGEPFLKDATTYRSTMQPSDRPGWWDLWYSHGTSHEGYVEWRVRHTQVPISLWDF